MWTSHEIRNKLENLKDKFHFKLPQMQNLLCQERFLLRLYQFKTGKNYIWKGGSLLVRRYQPHHQKQRFTVDLDLEAWKVNVLGTEEVFKTAMAIELKDGFQFFKLKKEPMKRDTPYGGERFSIEWSLFDKNQSEALKADEIIGYNPEAGGYFIIHDIYEEWALDKIIERAFSNEVGYKNFFNNYRGFFAYL